MAKIIEFIFQVAVLIAIILWGLWHYNAPERAENEARQNRHAEAEGLCNELLRASVLEKTKNTMPGFIELATRTLSTTNVRDGYVVRSGAYVRTLRQPDSGTFLRQDRPLYVLSCHVVNGQILKHEWIN